MGRPHAAQTKVVFVVKPRPVQARQQKKFPRDNFRMGHGCFGRGGHTGHRSFAKRKKKETPQLNPAGYSLRTDATNSHKESRTTATSSKDFETNQCQPGWLPSPRRSSSSLQPARQSTAPQARRLPPGGVIDVDRRRRARLGRPCGWGHRRRATTCPIDVCLWRAERAEENFGPRGHTLWTRLFRRWGHPPPHACFTGTDETSFVGGPVRG